MWRCVQQCALHWRRVARNRRRGRGPRVAMVADRQSRPAGTRVAMREGAFTHKEEGDLWNNLARLVFVYFIPVCPTLLQCLHGVALLPAFGAGQEPGQLLVLDRNLGTISQCIRSYVCVILWGYIYVHILQFVPTLFCTRYIRLSSPEWKRCV